MPVRPLRGTPRPRPSSARSNVLVSTGMTVPDSVIMARANNGGADHDVLPDVRDRAGHHRAGVAVEPRPEGPSLRSST